MEASIALQGPLRYIDPRRVVVPLRSFVFRVVSVVALATGCKREEPEVHVLWPEGAPGSEAHRGQREVAREWWVKNVHEPSLTVFRAKPGRTKGAAVIVMPGGGHERLVFGPEGLEPARFLADRGVTAFVLKYRLAEAPGSPYTVEEHARADGLRAVRWVRHHSQRFAIDPARIGVMGWSAGGEIAAMVSYGPAGGDLAASDPVDRQSGRPNFQIVVYPGSRGVPARLPGDAPPAFFVAANDDPEPARTVTRLCNLYREAQRPVELHLFAEGGHGFNMGRRSRLAAIRQWPERLAEWLQTMELIR